MSILFPTREELAEDWHNPRMTIEDIARKYGRGKSLISQWAKRYQLPRRDCGRKRIPNKHHRVEEFRAMWNDPRPSLGQISRHIGVCNRTLANWACKEGFPPRTYDPGHKMPLPPPCRQEQGMLPGDPTPEQIAERAAECRARRGLGFVFADE